MTEKICLILVAKRDDLVTRELTEGIEDERLLIDWVRSQNTYRLSLE